MATLTNEVKEFIVTELAMGSDPAHVAALVAQEFDIQIDRKQVFKYKPGKGNLSKGLTALYNETKEAYEAERIKIPIARKTFRLKKLQVALEKILGASRLNTVELRKILEQVAREEGGAYTNQRRIAGANGEQLFDTKAIANAVLQDLLREGMNSEEAIRFVVDRYQVATTDLVSEANN